MGHIIIDASDCDCCVGGGSGCSCCECDFDPIPASFTVSFSNASGVCFGCLDGFEMQIDHAPNFSGCGDLDWYRVGSPDCGFDVGVQLLCIGASCLNTCQWLVRITVDSPERPECTIDTSFTSPTVCDLTCDPLHIIGTGLDFGDGGSVDIDITG